MKPEDAYSVRADIICRYLFFAPVKLVSESTREELTRELVNYLDKKAGRQSTRELFADFLKRHPDFDFSTESMDDTAVVRKMANTLLDSFDVTDDAAYNLNIYYFFGYPENKYLVPNDGIILNQRIKIDHTNEYLFGRVFAFLFTQMRVREGVEFFRFHLENTFEGSHVKINSFFEYVRVENADLLANNTAFEFARVALKKHKSPKRSFKIEESKVNTEKLRSVIDNLKFQNEIAIVHYVLTDKLKYLKWPDGISKTDIFKTWKDFVGDSMPARQNFFDKYDSLQGANRKEQKRIESLCDELNRLVLK